MFYPDFNKFLLPVEVVQTGAAAVGTTVWTMRNTHATKTAHVTRILLAAREGAGSLTGYSLCRFSAATPTGGAAITKIQYRNTQPTNYTSCITDARVLDTGLTVAGVTFETPFFIIGMGVLAPSIITLDYNDLKQTFGGLEFEPGEGLAIRVIGAAQAANNWLRGNVEWTERL